MKTKDFIGLKVGTRSPYLVNLFNRWGALALERIARSKSNQAYQN